MRKQGHAKCRLCMDVIIKKSLFFKSSQHMVNDAKQEQENGDCKKNRDLKKPAVAII